MDITRSLFRLIFGRRLPVTDGTLEVPGVHQRILIRRDQYSIPYIEADNDEDAWYGLGFCQGQDRAFQTDYPGQSSPSGRVGLRQRAHTADALHWRILLSSATFSATIAAAARGVV
jgi:hypothetical protein